ncbi:MAG: HNH endonuclease, partial [Oscillospiraceae bacterium]|nr:HNH endonuclease [Oscillospiraceae bacterium]
MAREFAKSFYKSQAWRKTRQSFIKLRMGIDGGMCQECHERPGEIVHHRVWLNPDNINDANVTLAYANLELVCHA